MSSKLEQLKQYTTVVADTGDFDAIARLQPVDATTNPSLLLKAAALPRYAEQLQAAIAGAGQDLGLACDRFAVAVGGEILRIIPGRVSTEVDSRLSFDSAATIERAKRLIGLYEAAGIGRERVLIKVASTWEGIRAAERLERDGIQTNLTLLFSFAQAQACADAGVYLISPFVGRIYDWYKKAESRDFAGAEDPGVRSVTRIYDYYKANGYSTVVMGASFRNLGQIEQLAGCDRLTISPELLQQLAAEQGELPRRLDAAGARSEPRESLDESAFRWRMNEDAMATEKLAEGIRLFARDQEKLEAVLAAKACGRSPRMQKPRPWRGFSLLQSSAAQWLSSALTRSRKAARLCSLRSIRMRWASSTRTRTSSSDRSCAGISCRHSGQGTGVSTMLNTRSKPIDASSRVMSGLVVTKVGSRPIFCRERIDSLASRPSVVLSILVVSVRSMTITEKLRAAKIFSMVASSAEHSVRRTSPTNFRANVPSRSANWILPVLMHPSCSTQARQYHPASRPSWPARTRG